MPAYMNKFVLRIDPAVKPSPDPRDTHCLADEVGRACATWLEKRGLHDPQYYRRWDAPRPTQRKQS